MIKGNNVFLRFATQLDQRPVYDWLTNSDLTAAMMGPPDFAETPIPSWENFQADYVDYFFDGSQPRLGRSFIIELNGHPIGHISYSSQQSIDQYAEIDIWMKSIAHCGKGFGSEAIELLIQYLNTQLAVNRFVMRPSQRNQRAIRAYVKAGFAMSPLSSKEQDNMFGAGDYDDTVTLEQII